MTDPAFAEPRRRGRPPRVRIEGREDPEYDPAFQAVEDDMLDELEPTPEVEPAPKLIPQKIPAGWYAMDDAPRDGKAVWLMGEFEDGKPILVEAVWRNTRFFDRYNGGRWQIRGFWAIRNAGPEIHWSPLCWRPT